MENYTCSSPEVLISSILFIDSENNILYSLCVSLILRLPIAQRGRERE